MKFLKPKLEIVEFETEDVLTLSNQGTGDWENTDGTDTGDMP